jgi:colanic acid/amylovoran biosynthesis glycosyltransferase
MPTALWSLVEARGDTPARRLGGARAARAGARAGHGPGAAARACRSTRGISHLHAHFGTVATTVARLAAALAGIGYSFTAHAKDIYCDYEEHRRSI